MVVPDCVFCFDAKIKPSMISEVISKNLHQDKIHSVAKVIEHRALTVHNDPARHWADFINGLGQYNLIDVTRVSYAIKEFKEANGKYIDVRERQHTWFSDSYLFFSPVNIGITYGHPLYITDDQGRKKFHGVLAIDMVLEGKSFTTTYFANLTPDNASCSH